MNHLPMGHQAYASTMITSPIRAGTKRSVSILLSVRAG
jgi:hypothetical protein